MQIKMPRISSPTWQQASNASQRRIALLCFNFKLTLT